MDEEEIKILCYASDAVITSESENTTWIEKMSAVAYFNVISVIRLRKLRPLVDPRCQTGPSLAFTLS
jgi:hypothetical protein